jgi:hypothetical protein
MSRRKAKEVKRELRRQRRGEATRRSLCCDCDAIPTAEGTAVEEPKGRWFCEKLKAEHTRRKETRETSRWEVFMVKEWLVALVYCDEARSTTGVMA